MEHHRNVRSTEFCICALIVRNEGVELILRIEDWFIACGKGSDDVAMCAILNI